MKKKSAENDRNNQNNNKNNDHENEETIFYRAMPRYVYETHEYIEGSFLLTLDREFEWEDKTLKLKIYPVRMTDSNGFQAHHYAGKREELIEDAIRYLAVPENKNYKSKDFILTFSLKQLMQAIHLINDENKYDESDIKFGVELFAGTSYDLRDEETYIGFRPSGFLRQQPKDDDIIYTMSLSPNLFKTENLLDVYFPQM